MTASEAIEKIIDDKTLMARPVFDQPTEKFVMSDTDGYCYTIIIIDKHDHNATAFPVSFFAESREWEIVAKDKFLLPF